MSIETLNPIALFRYNDFVLLFMDNTKGRWFLTSLSAFPRETIAQIIGDILAEAKGDTGYLNGDNMKNLGVALVPIEKTTLPRDLPSMQILGTDPDLGDENTPRWQSSL